MSWLKNGDETAMHEIVLAPLEWEDAEEYTVNELFGCMARCASYVAGAKGDYIIRLRVLKLVGGSRWKALEGQAIRAGYLTRVELEDGSPAYQLVKETGLFHMISAAERERNNQHRNDTRNPKLTMPIRLRDGDQCRWCGLVVYWGGDKKSARAGTYDHLQGRAEPGTVETMVVACKACNESRQDDREGWTKQLLPAPIDPFYSEGTAKQLNKHGYTVTASDAPRVKEPSSGQTNGSPAAAHSATTPAPAVETPEKRPAPAPEPGPSQDASKTETPGSGRSRQTEGVTDQAAPGRDGTGSGRGGPGRAGGRAHHPSKPNRQQDPSTDQPRPGTRKRPRRRKRK